MEAVKRKPFEGVANILRFNWHFYVAVAVVLALLFVVGSALPNYERLFVALVGFAILASTIVSVVVSHYVYDVSPLYDLSWLDVMLPSDASVVNINAGFDEISFSLRDKFPTAKLTVLDFYDPQKHTEVSIKRARAATAPYPGTITVSTTNLQLPAVSVDLAICFLSAHEIRNADERTAFFRQLQEALKANGKIVVVEHLRDLPNLLAYTIGAFHFHAERAWKQNFAAANLIIEQEQHITPFITAFTLHKHGASS